MVIKAAQEDEQATRPVWCVDHNNIQSYLSQQDICLAVDDVIDVLKEAGFSSKHWKPLGRKLIDPKRHDIEAIEADNPTRVERCLIEVIERWIGDGENTWETLIGAVSQIPNDGGGENVALRISQRVGTYIYTYNKQCNVMCMDVFTY